MKINIKTALIVAVGSMALVFWSSCAKEKDESQYSVQRRILEAYLSENYPDAEQLPSGMAIISKKNGIYSELPKDGNGCYVHYSTYSLNGICQSTTDSLEARMLGTYSADRYYGPSFYHIGNNNVTLGMSELLKLVSEKGEVTAIMPPWLTSFGGNYMGSTSSGQESTVNVIYKMKMGKVFEDLLKFQTDSLESYSRLNFSPKIDSISSGFYFRNYTHPSGIDAADTVKSGTSVNVWYVGRLLDGYIFDTNIADTAKKYGLYSSSNTYEPLSVDMKEDYRSMSSGSGSSGSEGGSLVPGFARALKKMTVGDSAVTLFSSAYGYGASGKGVPEYSMLRFDITMENK